MVESVKPCLKVVGLHVEGLRALRKVDWPADGMGWGAEVPDLVMVGGINGSGKTTLLDFIADAARILRGDGPRFWNHWHPPPIADRHPARERCRGDRDLQSCPGRPGFRPRPCDGHVYPLHPHGHRLGGVLQWFPVRLCPFDHRGSSSVPGSPPAACAPPIDRPLRLPDETPRGPGTRGHRRFGHRFQPAKEWSRSLGALLYGARRADLERQEEAFAPESDPFRGELRQGLSGVPRRHVKRRDWRRASWLSGSPAVVSPLMELSGGGETGPHPGSRAAPPGVGSLDPHRRAGACTLSFVADGALDDPGTLAEGARRPGDRGHAEQPPLRHRGERNDGALGAPEGQAPPKDGCTEDSC